MTLNIHTQYTIKVLSFKKLKQNKNKRTGALGIYFVIINHSKLHE